MKDCLKYLVEGGAGGGSWFDKVAIKKCYEIYEKLETKC
jgi:hypothetical protein